jgi:Undecaprenyl-phosphate glucose phosphotransferase
MPRVYPLVCVAGSVSSSGVHDALSSAAAPTVGREASLRSGARVNFGASSTVLAIVESIVVIAAAVLAKYFYIDGMLDQQQELWPYVLPAPVMAFNLYLFLKQMGLHDPDALIAHEVGYGNVLGALAMAFLVLLGMLYIVKSAEFYSRAWVLLWFALSAVGLLAVRVRAMRRARAHLKSGLLRHRVALFGAADFITVLKGQLEMASPAIIVEHLYAPGKSKPERQGIRGGLGELIEDLARNRFDSVIIGAPVASSEVVQDAIKTLSAYSAELLLCTELEPFPVSVQGTRTFGRLRANVIDLVPLSERGRLQKLTLDYSVAFVGLVLLAPLFALIAMAIKLDGPGPVFFKQRRYGQNNQVFKIFKFRTMVVAEDGATVNQAKRNDPRVTRVGRLLRRTSIDELPQLINVILGDMSLVGPRPHALAHDEIFEKQLDRFSRRRRVRPGLTGWAQVHGFRGETTTVEEIRGRTAHDLYYIDNWSIWFDIEILTRTVFVLSRGAY